MEPLTITAERHDVQDTPVARWLRRYLKDPRIFTYYHRQSYNWVIATWLDKGCGMAIENAVITDLSNEQVVHDAIENVIWQRCPQSTDEVRKLKDAIWADEVDRIDEAQESADRHVGLKEFLRKNYSRGTFAEHPIWHSV